MSQSRRKPRRRRVWMPSGPESAKAIEARRGRARQRAGMVRDAESLPLRDAPWMRWDHWAWD